MVFKCPNCGADLRWEPGEQLLYCMHCGTKLDPSLYMSGENAPQAALAENADETYETNEFTCSQCGARIYSTDLTVATFCSYCGSSTVLEKRIVREKRPDYVIPFIKSREDCIDIYRKHVKRALFAPSTMTENSRIEKFRGIYMPYWVYSLYNNDVFSVTGTYSHRSGDYVYTDHYLVTTDSKAEYYGLNFDASSSFSDNISGVIAPFDARDAKAFNPAYLSGFYADDGDVDASVYEDDAEQAVREDIAETLVQDAGFIRGHVTESTIEKNYPLYTTQEKGLFPVWFLSIRSADNKRITYAAVNGQTGRVSVDLPLSFGKYLLFALLLAVPLFILLEFLFTLTPTKMLIITTILSVIAMVIVSGQARKVGIREQKLDDEGYLSVYRQKLKEHKKSDENKKEKGKSRTWVTCLILIIGIPLAFIAFIFLMVLFQTFAEKLLQQSGNQEAEWFLIPLVLIGIVFVVMVVIAIAKDVRRKKNERAGIVKEPEVTKSRMYYLWKPIAGVAVSVLVLMLKPVMDAYYYGAAIVSMLLILWSIYDIVKTQNILSTRKIPQFEKRGGDTDAVVY